MTLKLHLFFVLMFAFFKPKSLAPVPSSESNNTASVTENNPFILHLNMTLFFFAVSAFAGIMTVFLFVSILICLCHRFCPMESYSDQEQRKFNPAVQSQRPLCSTDQLRSQDGPRSTSALPNQKKGDNMSAGTKNNNECNINPRIFDYVCEILRNECQNKGQSRSKNAKKFKKQTQFKVFHEVDKDGFEKCQIQSVETNDFSTKKKYIKKRKMFNLKFNSSKPELASIPEENETDCEVESCQTGGSTFIDQPEVTQL